MYLGEKGKTSCAVPCAGGRTSNFWLYCDCANTSHAVLRFLLFFSVAGMPSGIQKQSHCCLLLFLACALLFTHKHLGAVPCPSHAQPSFEGGPWGCDSVPRAPCKHCIPQCSCVRPEPIHMCRCSLKSQGAFGLGSIPSR